MSSNFRHHLLGLSLLIGVAAPWAATAQAPISNVGSGSVEDRVTSLERISNAHSQLLTQLQQQLSDNQRDIDNLRGQIQESQYQLSQLTDRQKQISSQMGNLNAQSADSSAVATDSSAAVSPQVPASTGDENSDYTAAVSLALEKKEYDQAITSFQSFIKQYPQSTYQPNANYWLGQLYYNKGKKDDAVRYYAIVAKSYPKSPKSPDAMYKVGVIMQEKGQSDKAKAVFQQVIKLYPGTEAAKQSQKHLS